MPSTSIINSIEKVTSIEWQGKTLKVKTTLTILPGRNCIQSLLIKTYMVKEDTYTKEDKHIKHILKRLTGT